MGIIDRRHVAAWVIRLASAALLLAATGGALLADTGYAPPQYAGRCNPWPNDVPLPNEQLAACYVARYNCPVGVQPCRGGYAAELFTVNYIGLRNACLAGEYGPGHDCNPTTAEATDSSFDHPRQGPWARRWWWEYNDGGRPDNPVVVHDTTRACGPYSTTGPIGYPTYWLNTPPCGVPDPPAPRCGDGHADPGETCANCAADLGPCPPPPPPPDNALRLGVGGRFKVEATWTKPSGQTGPAKPLVVKRDGGAFTFFDAERPELYVNVIDGCAVSGKWWVFSAGLTNVGVDLTVTDTRTGVVWRHASPVGQVYATTLDTGAFPCP